ncbi:PspC domain-containing protein [Niastella sp. OAS944]|uniref:PspC domain-containing protein n=1 Tax=Niastella sp. OAS944 TaxID=2664089 RepID=UPI0034928BFD|nr:phage shock protein PspC (stress-responsive transcriptional regulator) [Chitinophagaceae bacterium OAS944]
MKKVININFQGRVVPIEETAFEILKQYIDSLRRYFANEEGRDEIINDIESRIAELFSETIKKGATCITDADVQAVMASMGRPEDFEAETGSNGGSASNASTGAGAGEEQQQGAHQQSQAGPGPQYATHRKLVRNADDKIIAGVCSGLANYFRIDPVIMRIIFVVLLFTGGSGLLVYLILWVAVPSQSVQSNITKRLYRSADDKVIAGVCGGLAAYLNINTWVPRLIFALPFILGLLSGPFHWWWDDFTFSFIPRVVSGSLGSTLFISYIVLWIAVPVAVTAAEKLEMRGERVDLNSIRDTVKEDLESFRSKAQNWGNEVKESAQQFGSQARQYAKSERVKTFTTEASATARNAGSGIAHIIGVLFKAFFLFIVGIVALALFGVLIAMLFGSVPLMSVKEFLLEGFWQNSLAWLTVFLFLAVPIISMITWLVRRIMGVRSKNHYLGYVFGTLWFIGIMSAALLVGSIIRSFKSRNFVEENVTLTQPSTGKLFLDVTSQNINYRYYSNDWGWGWNWDNEWPLFGANLDSIMLNMVRIDVVKSLDNNFHITKVRFSRGKDPVVARSIAEKINFPISQNDSTVYLPKGFSISKNERWRNQQVLLVLQVPVGKRFMLDRNVGRYDHFDVNYNHRGSIDISDTWERTYWVEDGKEYIMTPDGPKKVKDLDPQALLRGEYKEREKEMTEEELKGELKKQKIEEERERKQLNKEIDSTHGGGYRYQRKTRENQKDTTPAKVQSSAI